MITPKHISPLWQQALLIVLWVMALSALPIYASANQWGWDFKVYSRAAQTADRIPDLYTIGMTEEKEYAASSVHRDNEPIPLPFVYPPLTLVILRHVASWPFPRLVVATIYWFVYLIGYIAQLAVGLRFCKNQEHAAFRFLLPVAIFFPGLLQHDNILGGNISFIFYGAMLVGAYRGWHKGRWTTFYLVVLAGSCCKPPWLSLLALPLMTVPKEWRASLATAAVGMGLFVVQLFLWPSMFYHFLQASEMGLYYQGFGVSPAGIVAYLAVLGGHAFVLPSTLFYCIYTPIVAVGLLSISSGYRKRRYTLAQVAPVLVLGVFLLNPRIKDYDVAPLTIPMALLVWRISTSVMPQYKAAIVCALAFGACNGIAVSNVLGENSWNIMSCFLIVALFCGGVWELHHNKVSSSAQLIIC